MRVKEQIYNMADNEWRDLWTRICIVMPAGFLFNGVNVHCPETRLEMIRITLEELCGVPDD